MRWSRCVPASLSPGWQARAVLCGSSWPQLNQKGPPSPGLLGSPTLPRSTERGPLAATHASQGAGHVSRPGGVFRLTRPRKAPEKQLLSAAPGWWAQVGPAAALPATVHIQPYPPASDLDYTLCGRDPPDSLGLILEPQSRETLPRQLPRRSGPGASCCCLDWTGQDPSENLWHSAWYSAPP